MANATNKHKAQGKKPVVKKESWWTPQRVKIAIAAVVALIFVLIGVKIYGYVDGLQDSIVGKWSREYEAMDNGDPMEVVFTFNEDKSCGFIRTRNGVEEARMTGQYDIDENYDVITLMLGSGSSTVLQYYYDCDGDALDMAHFTTGDVESYVKVTE